MDFQRKIDMPSTGYGVKRVHFGVEVDWKEEANRSARGVEQRKKRQAKKKMEKTNRDAQIRAIATILINAQMGMRVRRLCRRSRIAGILIDAFLTFAELGHGGAPVGNPSRYQRCMALRQIHQNNGREVANWVGRNPGDQLMAISRNPDFCTEFEAELPHVMVYSDEENDRSYPARGRRCTRSQCSHNHEEKDRSYPDLRRRRTRFLRQCSHNHHETPAGRFRGRGRGGGRGRDGPHVVDN